MNMDTERKSVQVLYSTYGSYELSGPVEEAINWLRSRVDMLPEQYRASATIEFATDYDGVFQVEIYYSRPETDEEMERRIKVAETCARRAEEQERLQYERLKAKFG